MNRFLVVLVAAGLAGCTGSGNSAGTGATATAAGQTCDATGFEKSYRQIRDDHQKSWDRKMGVFFSGKNVYCPALKDQVTKLDRYIKFRQANMQCMIEGRKEILDMDITRYNRSVSEYQEKCG